MTTAKLQTNRRKNRCQAKIHLIHSKNQYISHILSIFAIDNFFEYYK